MLRSQLRCRWCVIMGETSKTRQVGGRSADARPEISVVVPVYNEVENVDRLHEALGFALDAMGRSYEILFIDDGSEDGTRELLRRAAASDSRLKAVFFRSNYGQTAAMSAGFDHARGDIVITMDGDLQNDPADIPRMVEELEKGYDIVCGWRRDRKDALVTRLLPSKFANRLISWTTGVPIHDTGCSLKAYRGWVVRNLTMYSDMHRFIAALAAGLGARVSEIPVRHHARCFGKSKYGLNRIFRVLFDLIVIKMLIQFSAHPIRWFGLLALPLFILTPLLFTLSIFSFEGGEISFAQRFDVIDMAAAGVTSLVALNVFLLGFLAELQLKASRFFQGRVSITAREASR